jgi:hypothetical protein
VESITGAVEELALPFFEQFTSIEEVYRVLKKNDKLSRLICPLPTRKESIVAAIEKSLLTLIRPPAVKSKKVR